MEVKLRFRTARKIDGLQWLISTARQYPGIECYRDSRIGAGVAPGQSLLLRGESWTIVSCLSSWTTLEELSCR